MITSYYRSQI